MCYAAICSARRNNNEEGRIIFVAQDEPRRSRIRRFPAQRLAQIEISRATDNDGQTGGGETTRRPPDSRSPRNCDNNFSRGMLIGIKIRKLAISLQMIPIPFRERERERGRASCCPPVSTIASNSLPPRTLRISYYIYLARLSEFIETPSRNEIIVTAVSRESKRAAVCTLNRQRALFLNA